MEAWQTNMSLRLVTVPAPGPQRCFQWPKVVGSRMSAWASSTSQAEKDTKVSHTKYTIIYKSICSVYDMNIHHIDR